MKRAWWLPLVAAAALAGCENPLLKDRGAGRLAANPLPPDLPIGAECRIELIQPPKHGHAWEGRIVKATPEEIVLVNATEEVRNFEEEKTLSNMLGEGQFGKKPGVERTPYGPKEIKVRRDQIARFQLTSVPIPPGQPPMDPRLGAAPALVPQATMR